jgi:hypothetical protein
MYSSDSKGSRSYRLRRKRSAAERVATILMGIDRVAESIKALPWWPHLILGFKNLGLWLLLGIGASLVTTFGLLAMLYVLLP